MEHKIRASFESFQDSIKFIIHLVDGGIDPETQIQSWHITREPIFGPIVEQHIVEYIIDDEYIELEENIGYDVEFLKKEHIKNYSVSYMDENTKANY